jgi:hypothetical protein
MANDQPAQPAQPVHRPTNWTQIIATVAGAVVVGMQGVNFAEISHGNSNGEKRMEILQEVLNISKSMDKSLENQTEILKNGTDMLNHDQEQFTLQTQILTTLRDAIKERREQLKQDNQ